MVSFQDTRENLIMKRDNFSELTTSMVNATLDSYTNINEKWMYRR